MLQGAHSVAEGCSIGRWRSRTLENHPECLVAVVIANDKLSHFGMDVTVTPLRHATSSTGSPRAQFVRHNTSDYGMNWFFDVLLSECPCAIEVSCARRCANVARQAFACDVCPRALSACSVSWALSPGAHVGSPAAKAGRCHRSQQPFRAHRVARQPTWPRGRCAVYRQRGHPARGGRRDTAHWPVSNSG